MSTSSRAVIPSSMAGVATSRRYSPGLVTGDLLFVAGQVGRDASGKVVEDPEKQFVTAFENVREVLAAAGAGFEHVVDLTTFHTSFDTSSSSPK